MGKIIDKIERGLTYAIGIPLAVIFVGPYRGSQWSNPELDEKLDRWSVIFWVVMGVIMICLAGAPIGMAEYDKMRYGERINIETGFDVPIHSLHDSFAINGQFFLGCGSVKGELEYVFYTSLASSSYQMESIPTSKTIIVEDEIEQPYLRSIYQQKVWSKTGEVISTRSWPDRYELHVPPGTVINEYELDGD